MNSEEIYQETILDHWRNPRNYGTLKNPTATFRNSNPTCGDVIEIYIKITNKKITNVKFKGTGCAISQAAASLLTNYIKGKSISFIKKLSKEEVLDLLNINLSPLRIKCALLCLKTLKYSVYTYLEKQVDNYDN